MSCGSGCGCCPKCGCQATCTCNQSMTWFDETAGDFSYIDTKSVSGGNGECSATNGWSFGTCGDDDSSECYFSEVVVNSKFGADSDCLDGTCDNKGGISFS
ncbi:uncharacterized protein [Physcomitrium patens]|uniref:Uncharacterized protein n=1 Tax=Physcomitrium patens TaxID=3218 RepID=A0A2K1JK62_PHYPA|nr:uncharacterized protein LOC112291896 [Physcomitrium patens]PNR41626.1 hypothetical protein PHYPA_019031 [Physcomitrium patens]|eukprot:XP_024395633.1 uncharacterized protein LOC112291896 [Physcomitrella patens]